MVGKKINPWVVVLVVMLPSCLELLDTGILNVVLPNIAASYGVTTQNSTWTLTAYLVASAIVLPISGWFSEIFGRKNYFFANIIIFGIGTVGCFFAPNFLIFLLCRIIQGFSGAGLLPPAQAIIYEAFEGNEKLKSIGQAVFAMGLITAPALGPMLGGYIASNYQWHDIYIIYFPIIIVGAILVYFFLQDNRESAIKSGKKIPIDYIGLALLIIGLGTLQIFLSNGQEDNWFQSTEIRVLCVTSIVSLIALVWWELKCPKPLLKLSIFKIRNVMPSVIVIFVAGLLIYGVNLIIPQYLQSILGFSAQDAGTVLSEAGLFSIFSMPFVAFGVIRFGFKKTMIFGIVLAGISVFMMTKFSPTMSASTAFDARVILSMGFGFIMMPCNMAAMAFITVKEDYDNVSGMLNLSRSMGGSLGIAIIETVIARMAQKHQFYLTEHINPFNPNFQQLLHGLQAKGLTYVQSMDVISKLILQQAYALAYANGFQWCFIMTVVLIPIVLFLVKDKKGGKISLGE